ncbi:sulfotransferase [Phycisphaeraceae bacterium D3-23]
MRTIDAILIEGFQARQRDLPEQALLRFEEALALEPGDPGIRLEVARTNLDLGLRHEAIAQLRAMGVDAGASEDDAEVALELARLWTRAGGVEEALALYRAVPRGNLHKPQAVLEAVLLLERTHRLDAARAEVAQHPHLKSRRLPDPTAALALAVLDEREGDRETASARLARVWRELPPSELTLECGYRLARLWDRMGRPREARGVLEQCKQVERTQMQAAALEQHLSARRASDRATLRELPADWFASRPAVRGAQRVMVLGHPRSGTSLMGRRLSQAGDAVWVDECPAFSVLARKLAMDQGQDGARFADYLGSLGPEVTERFTQTYLERIAQQLPEAGDVSDARLIDKNPGLSNSLPALNRLLPGSAWVYLERDPRDVAVSCYFQRMGATPLGWACQTLDGALEAVLHTASLWGAVRERLHASQAVVVRYETLVETPDTEVTRVLNELGWQGNATSAGADASKEPAVVHSPTYAEVRRPVDARAVERWRRHADVFGKFTAEHSQAIAARGYSA